MSGRKVVNLIYISVVAVLLFAGIFHRIYLIGESNFQNDEVGALNFMFGSQNFITFLLTRSIGPGEFIIAFITHTLFGGLGSNEFYLRLPFCLAGIGGLLVATYLCLKYLRKPVNLVPIALFAFSGYLIAFSRLVQYQSFLILIEMVCFWLVIKGDNALKNSALIVLGILCGVGGLFHYDMATFIVPLGLYILVANGFKKLLYFAFPLVLTLALFYIPFVRSPTFESTMRYLVEDRISDSFKYDGFFHSVILMSNYHSREFLVTLLVGALLWFFSKNRGAFTNLWGVVFVVVICTRFIVRTQNPLLQYISIIVFVIFAAQRLRLKMTQSKDWHFFLEIWFFFAFVTYGLVLSKPMTHTYTFLIPLFFLIGLAVQEVISRYPKTAFALWAVLAVVTISSVSFNYSAFNSLHPNYPWENKNYIFGSMLYNKGLQRDVGKTLGVGFGFLYNRPWQEIRADLRNIVATENIGNFKSNEKERIVKYYTDDLRQKGTTKKAYLYIKNPYDYKTPDDPYKGKKLIIEKEEYKIYTDAF